MLPFQRKFCVHHSTMHQVTVSLHSKPHRWMHVCLGVTCRLHFWQNDRGFYVLLWSQGCGTDTEIRVNTASWPWRRTFSRRSCRDSNTGPFDHESDALTTEIPRSPAVFICYRWPVCLLLKCGFTHVLCGKRRSFEGFVCLGLRTSSQEIATAACFPRNHLCRCLKKKPVLFPPSSPSGWQVVLGEGREGGGWTLCRLTAGR